MLIAITMVVISCQKDFTVEEVEPPVDPVNDSTLLKSYIELDTTLASGNDTVSAHIYTYDTQKRMTMTTSRFEFDHATGIPGISYILKFSYNGSDTLPYRITSISSNFDGIEFYSYRDTAYFFYNTSGQRTRDSITSMNAADNDYSVEVNRYSYSTGKMIVNGRVEYISGPSAPDLFESSDTLHINVINGNTLSQTDTSHDGLGEYTIEKLGFTYDTKINPFLLAQKMLNLTPVLHFEMDGWQLMQKNNPLQIANTIKYFDATEVNFGRRFTYIYKSNNFPASVIVKEYDPGLGTETFLCKGIFTYTQ